MSDIRTLLGEAETLALAVETAKGGVDAANARVEEAKAALEAARGVVADAKAGVEAAKSDLEGAYGRLDEAGLPKAKARKAVEDIIRVLAEAGVVVQSSTAAEASAPKPARKPRQSRRDEGSEGEQEAAPAGAAAVAGEAPASGVPAAATGGTLEIAEGHTLTVAAPTASEVPAQVVSEAATVEAPAAAAPQEGDVIVLGEIRDEEAARNAIAAAEEGTIEIVYGELPEDGTEDDGDGSEAAVAGPAVPDEAVEEVAEPLAFPETGNDDEPLIEDEADEGFGEDDEAYAPAAAVGADAAAVPQDERGDAQSGIDEERGDLPEGGFFDGDDEGGNDGEADAEPVAQETPAPAAEPAAVATKPTGFRRPSFLAK